MNQPGLFDTKPRARRTDPSTSHEAAKRAEKFQRGHHKKILEYLESIAPYTATYVDIANATELDRHAVARRLGELEKDGRIVKEGIGQLPNGNKAGVWRAV